MTKDMMSSDMALSLLSQVLKTNHHLRIAPIADVFASLLGGGGVEGGSTSSTLQTAVMYPLAAEFAIACSTS